MVTGTSAKASSLSTKLTVFLFLETDLTLRGLVSPLYSVKVWKNDWYLLVLFG